MSLEDLQLSIALRLAVLEDSLAKVEEFRHQLEGNAQKVREIHEAVNRHVDSLRMRETELVRQVEIVTAHEACRLSTQQARLMHSKGALAAASDLLKGCVNSKSGTLAKIKVDEMYYSEEVKPAKHISVQLEETALASAVSQFGSVQLPDTITHHPSPVIPVKVEEYEDEEHDVLHKSVAFAASEPSAPLHINVQFPRLTNHRQNENPVKTCTPPPKPLATSEKQSNDVVTWLGELQLSTAMPEDDCSLFQCGDSFDMVRTPTTSESSSIEIVPRMLDKDCSSLGSGVCEIENVHSIVQDKSRWLSNRTSKEGMKEEEKLDITSACMANETCRSFDECLCQNKCRDNALEKLQQTVDFRANINRKRTISEVEGINSIISHMAKIISSENSQWLLRKQNEGCPRPSKCIMYEYPGYSWLHQGSNSPSKVFPPAHQSSQCNTWLLKNIKNHKNAQEKDDKEKEKCTDEKDQRLRSEALLEALKRISVDPAKKKKQASRHQWQEKDKTINPVWLFSSQGKKEASIPSAPSQLQDSLPPMHVEGNSWLLY